MTGYAYWWLVDRSDNDIQSGRFSRIEWMLYFYTKHGGRVIIPAEKRPWMYRPIEPHRRDDNKRRSTGVTTRLAKASRRHGLTVLSKAIRSNSTWMMEPWMKIHMELRSRQLEMDAGWFPSWRSMGVIWHFRFVGWPGKYRVTLRRWNIKSWAGSVWSSRVGGVGFFWILSSWSRWWGISFLSTWLWVRCLKRDPCRDHLFVVAVVVVRSISSQESLSLLQLFASLRLKTRVKKKRSQWRPSLKAAQLNKTKRRRRRKSYR